MKISNQTRMPRRIRVQAVQQRMTLEQADMLEAWLLTLPQVECASVHERTRCAVIEYQGDRKDLLRILAGFSYQDHALAELVPVHSSRALNRAYEEKLVGMVAFKAVRSLFFPAPLRAVYTVIRSAPYLFRALRCLLRRQLPCGVVGWNLRLPVHGTAGLRHGQFRDVPAAAGRASGGVDPQKVRGKLGQEHVPEYRPGLDENRKRRGTGPAPPGTGRRSGGHPHGRA